MVTKQHWLLTGPGAISGLIAAGLIQQQQSVAWLRRACDQRVINWSLSDNGQLTHFSTPSYQPADPVDNVILAVKSYDLSAALQSLDRLHVPPDRPVIISHNGIVDIHSPRPLFPLLTTHAASREGRCVQHNGDGESWIASRAFNLQTELPALTFSALAHALPPLNQVDNIDERRWHKLLINCVINPLTAIYRIPNGALAEKKFTSEKTALIEEFVTVAKACGHDIERQQAYRQVEQVIQATAKNRSSMLVDIDNWRPTEIDAMNGYLVNKAHELGIHVPCHQRLVGQIKQHTKK